jgi:hypothetical protein
MRFKKEDLGLYFAFGLVGGGIGLLAGALLTNWLEKKAQKKVIEIEKELADDEAWEMTEEEKEEAEELYEMIKGEEHYVPSPEENTSTWHVVPRTEEEINKKPERARKEKRPNLSTLYSDEEIEAFIIEYEPNQIQLEMLRNNMMTMEQIIGVIELEEEANNSDPINYSGSYRDMEEVREEVEELEREILEELVEELGVVNDRFHILTGPPENSEEMTFKEIQWDPEDGDFFTIRRGHPIKFDIRTSIGHDTWDVVEPLLEQGLTDIYIVDQEKPRYYAFHKLVGLGEDDPSEHGSE